jgi:hypothetical protein
MAKGKMPSDGASSMPRAGGRSPCEDRHRSQLVGSVGSTGSVLFGAALLAGCCGDGQREMEKMADKYHDQAFACCKEIAELDPAEAVACFDSVKEWRLETGTLILQWYQACIADNEELARSIMEILRGMTSSLPGGECPMTAALPDGTKWAVGVPFAREDRLALQGKWVPDRGSYGAIFTPTLAIRPPIENRTTTLTLEEGGFSLDALGVSLSGTITGSLELGAQQADGFTISDASLRWAVGESGLSMRLADPDGLSRLSVGRDDGLVELRMSVVADERLGVLVPPVVWVRLPLTGTGLALDRVRYSATEIIPPAPGIADWNGDQEVDDLDWVAYWTTEPLDGIDLRDVDLDGDFDAADAQRFVSAWRDRYGM